MSKPPVISTPLNIDFKDCSFEDDVFRMRGVRRLQKSWNEEALGLSPFSRYFRNTTLNLNGLGRKQVDDLLAADCVLELYDDEVWHKGDAVPGIRLVREYAVAGTTVYYSVADHDYPDFEGAMQLLFREADTLIKWATEHPVLRLVFKVGGNPLPWCSAVAGQELE